MNKKLIKTIASVTCGFGVVGGISACSLVGKNNNSAIMAKCVVNNSNALVANTYTVSLSSSSIRSSNSIHINYDYLVNGSEFYGEMMASSLNYVVHYDANSTLKFKNDHSSQSIFSIKELPGVTVDGWVDGTFKSWSAIPFTTTDTINLNNHHLTYDGSVANPYWFISSKHVGTQCGFLSGDNRYNNGDDFFSALYVTIDDNGQISCDTSKHQVLHWGARSQKDMYSKKDLAGDSTTENIIKQSWSNN